MKILAACKYIVSEIRRWLKFCILFPFFSFSCGPFFFTLNPYCSLLWSFYFSIYEWNVLCKFICYSSNSFSDSLTTGGSKLRFEETESDWSSEKWSSLKQILILFWNLWWKRIKVLKHNWQLHPSPHWFIS